MAEKSKSPVSRLSPRQRECISLVGNGLTTKEIALRLKLEPKTVDSYIADGIEVLGARSRAHAAMLLAAPLEITAPEFPALDQNPPSMFDPLPFRSKGAIGNDLNFGQRVFWIIAIAFVGAIAFGMLAIGIHFLSDLVRLIR